MNYTLLGLLLLTFNVLAIDVGTMTFAMNQDKSFVSKRVLNNNKNARVYQITVRAIDSPSENELRSRPADGELLFAPKQLTLQAGQSEYFKFFYHGPKDNQERYYRISFREIPVNYFISTPVQKMVAKLEPIIVMDTVLVVRPRQTQFAYQLDKKQGVISNTGNTYFKFLIKPGCNSRDEQGTTVYLRPGERYQDAGIKLKGKKFIIYDESFINIDDSCSK